MKYEMLYIIPATKTDDEVAKIKDEVTTLVKKYAQECTRDEALGKLKLAYPMKHVRYGHYVLICFQAEPETVTELDRELRHSQDVLRHMITKMVPGGDTKEVALVEYQIPDVYKKRAPRKSPPKAPAAPAPVQAKKEDAPAPAMSEEQLDKQIDKILDGDIK